MKNLILLWLLAAVATAQAQSTTTNPKDSLPIPSLTLDTKGELVITPSATSSAHDFDFYVGKWKLHNRRLNCRLQNCTEWSEFEASCEMKKVFSNSIVNYDVASFGGNPFQGFTLRLFNPKTKLWSLYYTDSKTGVMDPPVVGSFENGVGHFFTKDVYEGKKIIVVFRWDARDPDNPIWSQAFSPDNGKTWEWNWYIYQSRWQE